MDQTRDFRALAEIKNGGLRCEAWKIGGVGRQAVRDRVLAFNAEGPAGLVDRKAPGNRPILTDAQRHDLMRIVESGPTPAVHGVVPWRLIGLAPWGVDEVRGSISKQTLNPGIPAIGLPEPSGRS